MSSVNDIRKILDKNTDKIEFSCQVYLIGIFSYTTGFIGSSTQTNFVKSIIHMIKDYIVIGILEEISNIL